MQSSDNRSPAISNRSCGPRTPAGKQSGGYSKRGSNCEIKAILQPHWAEQGLQFHGYEVRKRIVAATTGPPPAIRIFYEGCGTLRDRRSDGFREKGWTGPWLISKEAPMNQRLSSLSELYERLFARCPVLRFPEPWTFVSLRGDCRACVTDPAETLTALCAEFGLLLLQAAGVIDRLPDGTVQLAPHLCDPEGAVIALRAEAGGAPFELLTAAGCLSGLNLPLQATLHDSPTATAAQQTGRVFACYQIRDVAILRTLGFPATLCTGLDGLTFPQLCSLDKAYGSGSFNAWLERVQSTEPWTGGGSAPPHPWPEPGLPPAPWAAENGAELASPGGATRPDVVLVGWNLWQLDATAPAQLGRVATTFDQFGQFLGYDFSWLGIWRLSAADIEILRYRLTTQVLPLALLLLHESTEQLYVLSPATAQVRPTEPEASQPADYAEAQADLLAKLAASGVDRNREVEARKAKIVYDDLMQRDLIRPLQDWRWPQLTP